MKTRRLIDIPVRAPRRTGGPLWRDLAESIAWQIDIGRLDTGSRLPATRTLARALSISRTTVLNAYDELASRGYLRARVGDGAYVAGVEDRVTSALAERMVRNGWAPDGTTIVLIR